MAFPTSPTEGQTYKKYKFSSNKWEYLLPLKVPNDPVAYWSLDDVPEIPDDPAGVTYLQDEWATVDGWLTNASTISTSSGKLNIFSEGDCYIYRTGFSFSGAIYDTIRIKFDGAQSHFSGEVFYATDNHGFSESYKLSYNIPINGGIVNLYMGNLLDGGSDWINSTIKTVRFDLGGSPGQSFNIDFIYIGTGKYLGNGLVDNSGNGNHATIYGATPVPGISGKALAFDGVNDYVVTKSVFTIQDIMHYHVVYKGVKEAKQHELFSHGYPTAAKQIGIRRNLNTDNLYYRYYDGTSSVDAPISFGFFTGLDNTWIFIDISINYTAGTISVFRNGVFVLNYTMTDQVKPNADDYVYIGALSSSLSFGSFTIDEPRIYDRALSEAEIKSLYLLRKDNIYVLD